MPEAGDHVVASRNLYGGSITQLGHSFRKLGWTTTFVEPTPEAFRAALTERTKAIFVESLANPGSVFTFGVKGGYAAGVRLVEACELFSHLANVGDARSLVLHPASTTHRQLSDEQRAAAGAGPDVIRLSVGLETADDLVRDLDQALAAAAEVARAGPAEATAPPACELRPRR